MPVAVTDLGMYIAYLTIARQIPTTVGGTGSMLPAPAPSTCGRTTSAPREPCCRLCPMSEDWKISTGPIRSPSCAKPSLTPTGPRRGYWPNSTTHQCTSTLSGKYARRDGAKAGSRCWATLRTARPRSAAVAAAWPWSGPTCWPRVVPHRRSAHRARALRAVHAAACRRRARCPPRDAPAGQPSHPRRYPRAAHRCPRHRQPLVRAGMGLIGRRFGNSAAEDIKLPDYPHTRPDCNGVCRREDLTPGRGRRRPFERRCV